LVKILPTSSGATVAIPLHTFEPTGDPCVDDLAYRLYGKFPLLKDWFGRNSHVLKYTPDEITAESEPYQWRGGPSDPGIYFLVNDSKIVYIGKALSIAERLRNHFMTGKRFSHYWCFGGMPYEWLGDVEGFYIKRCRPALNKMHVIYSRDLDKIVNA
jgi:hypothetical protein